jgi:hypothetical protein
MVESCNDDWELGWRPERAPHFDVSYARTYP